MEYFKLTDTPELEHAPKLKNWYGRFDVRDITLASYTKLPNREMFFVEEEMGMQFTDIILFPFLLISHQVNAVIKMYREVCFTKEIVLFDQRNERAEIYYLPVFDETDQIRLATCRYEDGVCVSRIGQSGMNAAEVKKHIFWVKEGDKRHTILSLDLAESLIRRGITGLGLEEVRLYNKEEKGDRA